MTGAPADATIWIGMSGTESADQVAERCATTFLKSWPSCGRGSGAPDALAQGPCEGAPIIYLDTNHWVSLRAEVGRDSARSQSPPCYQALRGLTANGAVRRWSSPRPATWRSPSQ